MFPIFWEVGMPSARPLQWIEQVEAREMMADAIFRHAPAAARRKRARNVILEALANAVSYIVPEPPMPQMRPVLVRRQDRRQNVLRRDDYR
jgi:hypothetical protein